MCVSKSLKCALTFSRQIISKCSVNRASQSLSFTPPVNTSLEEKGGINDVILCSVFSENRERETQYTQRKRWLWL